MTPSSTYTITELLSRGSSAIVYRAVRDTDGRPVILKVLDPQRSRPKDLERLKHEYEIGKLIDSPAVVEPLALETYQGMPALVLEDFGGQSLDGLLGMPMAVERFLKLAVRITEAVADVHEHGVVHKDLKPQNIIVNATTGQVKLADFGIASRLPREQPSAGPPRLIEGALPYLSPEQTGRTNQAIDSRSDLYTLGVTFYEMLTGRLPFEARDPVEWVHCHVARAPPPPSTIAPELPLILSALVLKLLAKMPEERYQTARGLQKDLERCLPAWRTEGRLEPFPLAEHDVSDRFQIPQRLYGREDEVTTLLRAFERVIGTGSPELVLVAGYSGIGKSALVQELHKPIVRERGFFISGKFDQYKRDIPYSTLVQAFRELVLEILAGSEEQIADWRQRLLGALGINAQLIVDVIPQVELVIGRQPPVAELPPTEAQNRFRIVFRHFIGVFAQEAHPLALFLDDLQWADPASLGLLEALMTHSETRHLLVIGAYRDNEVTPVHPLILTLDKVRKEGARVSIIVLGPLSREHLVALIGDTLHCRREDAAPLADLVHEKTAGNPFFAIQFLTALHEERLIEFDGRARIFRWDVAKIHAKGFTDNVVALMVGKLVRLPASTQEALKRLACLGNTAPVAILTIAHGRSEEETHADLWEAVRAGLILRLDGTYKFLHDRVQEAAYSLIPEGERASVHLAIGRLLSSRTSPEELEERVFDIVDQLDRGSAQITSQGERERVAELNLMAGKRAKASTAYASALKYLAAGSALLAVDSWERRYELKFTLDLNRAECDYLVGNFQRADVLLNQILENARSPLDRARAYQLRTRLYQLAGRYGDAVTTMLEAVRFFGTTFPESEHELKGAMDAEIRAIHTNLDGRRIADIVDAPMVTDPDVGALITLLVESLPAAYNARPHCFPLIAAKAVNLSLHHGNNAESCHAYSAYAIVLVSLLGDIPAGFEFSEMSLRLNEKLDDRRLRGQVIYIHGCFINCWRKHFSSGLPLLRRAFSASLEVGDLVFAGYAAWTAVLHAVENGDSLDEVLKLSQKYATFARESHNDTVYEAIRLEQQLAVSLKGSAPAPTSGDGDACNEATSLAVLAKADFGMGMAIHHVMKLQVAVIYGLYAEALGYAAAGTLRQAMATPAVASHCFYHALTLTALYPQAPAAQQQAFTRTLQIELQKLEIWADNCPENFRNRHALVSAEIARIEGRALDAERLYEDAIRSACANGFVQNEALANELASRFYRARGFDKFADTYLRDARACYARWGADGKVSQIDRQNPHPFEPKPLAPTATFAVRPEQLDLLSVTKASQTISSEIVFDKLLRTLLAVVLEQGGAQRACLILCQGSGLSMEAEAVHEEKGAATNILGPLREDFSQRVPMSLVRYVQRTKEHVLLGDAATNAGKFSGDDYFARLRPKSVLCMPILRQAEVVGLIYLENNLLVGAFTPDRLVALSLLATQAAISLQNAQLLAKENAARTAAEDAEQRSAFLAEAGDIVSQSLDYEQTLARLGRLAVRSLCDWCVIDIVEGREIRRISGAHKDPAKEPSLQELQRRYPPRWDSPHPAATVLRTGEPLLMPELPDDLLRSTCEDDEHARLLRALGTSTAISVPLVAHGQTLGAFTIASAAPGRRYGRADLELVQEAARRAAIAIENARLYGKTQEAIRARDEFLAVASHELNTPVTSLMLALQSMDRALQPGRSVDPQAMRTRVERALRQGTRLTRLNRALVDVSQIHAARLPLDLVDVDLETLVREVVDRFKPELSRAGRSVSLHGSSWVVGHWDRSRIDQILTNLLSNAVKFGAGKPIEISFGEEAGIARIAVRDHGIGIDPAQQGQIFDRFGRAVSMNYGGLGLGLYICRWIAEAHGGTIRVQSKPGEGSTFIVDLPRAGPDHP